MSVYITEQRKILLEFLKQNHDKQLSASDIAGALKNKGISISAVYRNLSNLSRDCVISRSVKEGSRESYYQYIDGNKCKDSIHLTCTKCGKVSHMDSSAVDQITASLKKSGFNINKTKTVVYGVCQNCE